jgi:polyhydroxybutyrate depolymerase
MARGKMLFGTALALIGLPVPVVLIEAVSFYAKNWDNGAMVSSGERRTYELFVPLTYDPTRPTPLVISLHAAGLWGAAQEETSQWDRVAERAGAIVVYPSGLGEHGLRIWRVEQGPGLARDVRFIADLIDTIAAHYNIDRTRIYANGLSNGGGMSFVLSCALPDRIAAVGLVAAAQTLPWSWCADRHPVPMIAFHGTADAFVPYNGGKVWLAPEPFPNVPQWAANWARRNQCAPAPVDSLVVADVSRRVFARCAGNATVELFTIHGGGHTWPGGTPLPQWFVGKTTMSIDASRMMWKFFRDHPLRH